MSQSRPNERPMLEFSSRAEWRAWLSRNHADSKGVWLAIDKKNAPHPALSYDDAVEEALCFGWIDSTTNRLDDHRTRQLYTPRKPRSTWARSNKQRVERLIAEGRMTPAGNAAIEVAKANGSWDALADIEAEVVPDDLAHALEAEPGAREAFEALSHSRRRAALYWVSTAKRAETREERIRKTVEAARAGQGPLG